jgi:hypothetical protein
MTNNLKIEDRSGDPGIVKLVHKLKGDPGITKFVREFLSLKRNQKVNLVEGERYIHVFIPKFESETVLDIVSHQLEVMVTNDDSISTNALVKTMSGYMPTIDNTDFMIHALCVDSQHPTAHIQGFAHKNERIFAKLGIENIDMKCLFSSLRRGVLTDEEAKEI